MNCDRNSCCTCIILNILSHVDIGYYSLQLSVSITSINIDYDTVSRGVALVTCTRLTFESLRKGDCNCQLPDSITNINIEDLNVTGGVLL